MLYVYLACLLGFLLGFALASILAVGRGGDADK